MAIPRFEPQTARAYYLLFVSNDNQFLRNNVSLSKLKFEQSEFLGQKLHFIYN
jgi:hypothetical protein